MKIVAIKDPPAQVAILDLPATLDAGALPYVFLHGLGSSSIATFPEIAAHPALAASRSILIDLPGFGYSSARAQALGGMAGGRLDAWSFSVEDQAQVVVQVLAQLGISRVQLVGHSMGGSIAIALAATRPDLVARLVVAEPNLDPGRGNLSAHIARRSEREFVERGYGMLVRGMQQQASRGDTGAAIFLRTVLQASPVALHRAAVSLRAERTPTFRAQFLEAPMPRTFIAGEHSRNATASELVPFDIEYVEIPGAGHVMMDDDPDAFARAVASGAEHAGSDRS